MPIDHGRCGHSGLTQPPLVRRQAFSTAESAGAIVNTLRGRPHLAAVRAAGVDATAQAPRTSADICQHAIGAGGTHAFGTHRGAEMQANGQSRPATPANEAAMSDPAAPAKPRNETRTETMTPRARSIKNRQDFQKVLVRRRRRRDLNPREV